MVMAKFQRAPFTPSPLLPATAPHPSLLHKYPANPPTVPAKKKKKKKDTTESHLAPDREKMAKCCVLMFLVLALVLVHATARNMPDTEKKDTDVANTNNNHKQANVNVVNVPKAMGANGKAVKDKKCGVVFAGLGGAAGVGGVAGVIPLGGIGGIGGIGGAGGVGGAAGKGGGIGVIP